MRSSKSQIESNNLFVCSLHRFAEIARERNVTMALSLLLSTYQFLQLVTGMLRSGSEVENRGLARFNILTLKTLWHEAAIVWESFQKSQTALQPTYESVK